MNKMNKIKKMNKMNKIKKMNRIVINVKKN